jgi:protein ImuB
MFACLYSPSASQASLLALASSFSPLVEDTAPGIVIFSIVGLSKLIGTVDHIASEIARIGAAAKIQGNLAIAADPDAARIVARHIGGLTMIPPGREQDRLSGLPIHVLGDFIADGDLRILDTLDRWGIKTLGEIAALPPLGFIARFGELGERLLRLARGETQRALRVRQAPETYERRVDLEHPQALLEPLLFVLSSMLQELMTALECQGFATNRVTLGLALVKRASHKRTLEFPIPVRDVQVILKQLQFDLEAHPPAAAILGVEVKLNPVEPRALQHGLFIPQAPTPEKLSLTLARLNALVGDGNAGSPELLDTHRPDAFRMRTFAPTPASELTRTAPSPTAGVLRFAFRYARPAPSAQVRLKSERPITVKLPVHVNMREVLAAAGPWKTSGDWWTSSPWDREEWDVELNDGGLYRVFRASEEWFLEGVYD